MEPKRTPMTLNSVEETSSSSHTDPIHEIDRSVSNPTVTPTEEYTHVFPTGFKLASVLTGITVSYFLLFLDLAIISTATPSITSEFNSLTDLGWYSGAYQLASAAFQPLSGKIYRYLPLKVSSSRLPGPAWQYFAETNPWIVVFSRLLLHL